jgi:hypothetical protein
MEKEFVTYTMHMLKEILPDANFSAVKEISQVVKKERKYYKIENYVAAYTLIYERLVELQLASAKSTIAIEALNKKAG